MKLSMAVIFGVLLSTQVMLAKTADSQVLNRKINISIENTSLYNSIKNLEKVSDIRFSFNSAELKNHNTSVFKFKDQTLGTVLSQLLEKTGLRYAEVESGIVIYSTNLATLSEINGIKANVTMVDQQDIQVKGKVSDENGPLIGVSVRLQGAERSTVTNSNGEYNISAPANGILVFSYIGYETRSIPINNQQVLNVTMKFTSNSLQDVVVTGYRTQTRGSITGSVSSINSTDIQNQPVENLSNALAGRLSGVTVIQGSGTPGMASSIRIRTVSTINNQDPLYVIDGVVSDKFAFDGLSPSEVESVTILKDGASAAIYGSRAANGVVLVTTKRGKTGAPKLSYSALVGVQNPTKIPETFNAFDQAYEINRQLQYNKIAQSDVRYYTQDELDYFKANSWNWIDEMWRDPLTTQHTMDISGGSETVKYFLGGSYNYANASFNSIDFQKYTIRGNVDVSVSKNLKVSLDINTDNRHFNGPNWRNDNWRFDDLYKALLFRPSIVPPYINGMPVGNWVEWHPGVVLTTDISGYNKREYGGLNSTISINYNLPFIEGLTAKVALNKYSRNQYTKEFSLPYNMTVFNTTGTHNHIVGTDPVGLRPRSAEEFLRSREDKLERYQFNAQLNYKKSFNKNNIDALFVYEQAEEDNLWFNGRVDDIIAPSVDQYNGGLIPTGADGNEQQLSRISYVGLVGYNYAGKYLVEGSFRYDGSVTFPPQGRWGFFPSLSVGWRISEEPFFKNIKFIDDLKLRGSVGLLGNDAVGRFQYLQSYNIVAGALFNNQQSFGLQQGVLANPNITWEKSLSYNAGLDSRFFDNFDLKLDFFYRHTYDILQSRQASLPSTLGASLPDENYMQIDANGFEASLGYSSNRGSGKKAFSYFVRGNFGYAKNKYVVLNEPANIRPYLSRKGKPIGGITGYRAIGILRTQADLDALPAGYTILGVKPQLGMLNYQDLRGPNSDTPDGKITTDDKDYLADYQSPPINYGMSLGGSFGPWSVDVLLQGTAGAKSMMSTVGRDVQARVEESSLKYWSDSWSPDNPDGKYPGYRVLSYRTRYDESSFWLQDLSFLRLKNINLSYNLPEKIMKKAGLNGARVYFTGSNLLMIYSKEKIYDPEMENIQSYPMMKTYSFGLNITL